MEAQQHDQRITIGAQPTPTEIEELARDGFKAVVNLRTPGEESQPLSPQEEEAVARQAGLTYCHIPVSSAQFDPQQVDQFREALKQIPAPVYVHCKGGTRAGRFVLLNEAVESGQTGEQMIERARQMGYAPESEALCEQMKAYVDRTFEAGD